MKNSARYISARILLCSIATCFLLSGTFAQSDKKVWKDAEAQLHFFYKNVNEARKERKIFPRALEHDTLKLVPSGDWTSGFWPGMLWFMYGYTKDAEWKNNATAYTSLMANEPTNRNSHDVGFKVYNSYGNGYRYTRDDAYRQQVIKGAATLITRFNPTIGCIRSWDFGKWQYPVIIDNMMNLELLFAASRFTGDSAYYKIAVTHANTTLRNHFRADNSCYHVMDYDTITGMPIGGSTHQGYSDQSSWARGQAWALYGFTLCYRETKDAAYLLQAEKIASFLLNHPRLPADKIPYWDFDAPASEVQPRDASAAAIIASALYELSTYSKNKKMYRQSADAILKSLVQHFRAPLNSSQGFLLLHSTGNKPFGGEIDVPIIYADYYFMEALLRKKNPGSIQ